MSTLTLHNYQIVYKDFCTYRPSKNSIAIARNSFQVYINSARLQSLPVSVTITLCELELELVSLAIYTI